MKQKILKLTEAFSIQPESWSVCQKEMDYHKLTPDIPHKHSPQCIKEIFEVCQDDKNIVYMGFNFQNQRMFEIQSKSVNVFYEINQ